MKLTLFIMFFCISAGAASVLHIGDSHSAGYFGDKLTQKFKQSEDQFVLLASCGAGASHFNKGKYLKICNVQNTKQKKTEKVEIKNLQEIINEHQPEIVSIALGSNDLGLSDKKLKDEVTKILETVEKSKAKCIWSLAPPMPHHITKIAGFNEKLKTIIKDRCQIVDPNIRIPKMYSRDGLHFSIPSEVVPWAEDVYHEILKIKAMPPSKVQILAPQKPQTSNLQ